MLVRQDQKSADVIQGPEVLLKFRVQENCFMSLQGLTMRFSMLLPLYRRCSVPDHETECRKHGLRGFVEVFEKHVFNNPLDRLGTDEVKSNANLCADNCIVYID